MWKLVLAESEKGVLIWVGSADSQGVYALVSSLGSLFVRIILQPFEVSERAIRKENVFGCLTKILSQEAAFFAFAKNSVSNDSARVMESGYASMIQSLSTAAVPLTRTSCRAFNAILKTAILFGLTSVGI